MIARELTDFFATFGDAPHIYAADAAGLPLQRQRGLPARVLGGDPVRRRALQRGPGVRSRRRRPPALAQGLPPGRRGPPCPRLRRRAVHAPLLRRVPRAARDDRSRRAAGAALARCSASATRWPPTGVSCASTEIDDIARWTARSVVHHSGRKAFAVLGSRARALPPQLQRTLSLEGRAGAPNVPVLKHRAASQPRHRYEMIERAKRTGPAPLLAAYPGMADRERLHIAWIDPDVQHRLGWPLRDLPDRRAARADGPHLLDLGARRLRRSARGQGQHAAARHRRTLRAGQGAGVPRARRLVRGRRGGRDRLADRLSDARAAGLPGPRVHGQRPRARVLPDIGRARVGGEHVLPRPLRRGRQSVAARPVREPLRRRGRDVPIRRGQVRLLPADGAPSARHRDRVRARRDAAPRRRARVPGARRAQAPAPRRADRAVRQRQPAARPRSSTRTPASPGTSSSPGCSPRRPRDSACR